MPKGDQDKNISDTGNWNVAADYSKFKIMKYLYLADEYSAIATFGHSNLIEELQSDISVEQIRISGLRRLIDSLIILIDNTHFAIKNTTDKKNLDDYRKELKKAIPLMSILYKTVTNVRLNTRRIKIDEVNLWN